MSDNEDYYIEKTNKYADNIRNGHKIEHALKRLKEIPMNLEILKQTNIGILVSKLKGHHEYGQMAEKLVKRWKESAKAEKEEIERREKNEEKYESSPESSASIREKDTAEISVPNRKRKNQEKSNGNIPTDPFSQAMLSLDDKVKTQPKSSKKMKLPSIDEITAELGKHSAITYDHLTTRPQNEKISFDELDPQQFKARKDIRKVFAGRKREATFKGPIPKLFNLCIRTLQGNIDTIGVDNAMAYLYAKRKLFIPYDVFKPVLEKCSEAQLARIEEKNPHFERDADELWRKLCHKKFPETASNQEWEDEWGGSWKQCLKELTERRAEKLEQAKKKIAQHVKETTLPQRQTLMSDAIAPRNVRRRQEKHGISAPSVKIPTAVEISKSRRQIFENGNKADLKSLPTSVRNTTSTLGAHSSSSTTNIKTRPAKKGTLMVKALKMMKGNRR